MKLGTGIVGLHSVKSVLTAVVEIVGAAIPAANAAKAVPTLAEVVIK